MLYNLKEWLRQAPKDALVKAANVHSVSNGITTPWQLRRMLWDNYTWNYSDSNSLEVARYLSACIGEQSTVTEHPEHGHLIVKTIEHDIQVVLDRAFQWVTIETTKPATEERLGESLVEQASMAAPQKLKCPATVYGPNGISQVDHVVDMPHVMCRCEMATIGSAPEPGQEFWEFVGMADKQQAARLCLTPETVVAGSLKIDAGGAIWLKGVGPLTVAAPEGSNGPAFVPVEPNPDSLDDLYLEDLLGHYATLELRSQESDLIDDALEHIERRFEKQGWLISRIKGR